ncbi:MULTISPECIES: DUF3203 family protein [unclassified Pseudomonas]|uniref:DUF3203 family protein n=1 Tax=unclassified Pseudomonas TaxID=196821 RepID=UPI000F56ABEB|nr:MULTISPECIES: DUF3203 family protein [unclassified Pseudomonas]AZF27219.1 hypothetical protein C4J90_3048 [Pseudomonas sp. R2-60-08W]AZF32534.1 hypothetical protein C4J89_3061 [Pseudomonas sp. R4-35-07]AZF42982.1 hypothetical protein C4J87_2825 [Pseudomonas sp. R1-43-08]AZF48213.1 hypothetical protein C4J86_2980 [Pseudomonas sp. R2-7-07]AZF53648.1 hypothetical protein C4J85_3165 [Pseudomonas sp. R4-34-07]
MSLRIEDQLCYFTLGDNAQEHSVPATRVNIATDTEKSMSYVELAAERIYITEAEADALTVAGAHDGRQHVKADAPGSVI